MSTSEGFSANPSEPNPVVIQAVDMGPIGTKQRYEFTNEQESTIGDLADKMRFVGAFLFAFAGLGVLQVVNVAIRTRFFDWFTAINTLVYGLIGYWTLRASGGFTEVVETTGWDVSHLMDALESMRKMYALLFWLLIMAFVASLILTVWFFFLIRSR